MASAYLRSSEEGTLLVALNAGEEPARLDVAVRGELQLVPLPGTDAATAHRGGVDGTRLELPPRQGSVWRVPT